MRLQSLSLLFALTGLVFTQDNRPVNTYSIVALDEKTGELGVAVQSHWFSVGSIVPWARAGVGAVATQSIAKVEYGPHGLQLMAEGLTADQALAKLVADDPGASVRQVGMVDAQGNVASHTGDKCIAEAGFRTGKYYTVQANIMEKSTVWDAMAEAYENTPGDLADRMMAAMEAAQNEGGDLRGKQSASILIVKGKPTEEPWNNIKMELRIEDHPEPIKELKRLINIHRAYEHANKGDHYLELGEMENALKEYKKSAEYYPENPELPFWTAVTLVTAGELDRALPIFKDVFQRNPKLKELVPRLVPSGFFPEDKEILQRVMEL